jgi:hypothetical protein
LERAGKIDEIAQAFVKATKGTKDWTAALQDAQTKLDRIGASAAEVDRVLEAGTSQQASGRGSQALQAAGRALPVASITVTPRESAERMARPEEGSMRLELRGRQGGGWGCGCGS